MSDTTARLRLPTIRPGQAQKELSHNEALALIDMLTQASVIGFAVNTPPLAPTSGDACVIGAAPTGAWAGKAQQMASWTDGGWRFVVPVEGLATWIQETSVIARFSGGDWSVGAVTANRLMIGGNQVVGERQPAIATPMTGGTIDIQARIALAAILSALRTHGLVSSQ